MFGGATVPDRFDTILDAHQKVRAFLRACDEGADLDLLRQALGDLAAGLGDHFGEEEREGGFFDTLLHHHIASEPSVAALKDDHTALMGMVTDLLEGWATRNEVHTRSMLATFTDRLGNHELFESGLADDLEAELG